MVNSDKYNKEQKKLLLKRLEAEAVVEDPKAYTSRKINPIKIFLDANKLKIGLFSFLLFIVVSLVIIALNRKSISNVKCDYVGTLMPSAQVLGTSTSLDLDLPSDRCDCENKESLENLSANSYMVLFEDNFQVATSKNMNEEVAFASIVKLLGALVSIEYYDLEQTLVLKEPVDTMWNGLDLEVGEGTMVKDLLGAALVGSRNDAMFTLAQNYEGGQNGFVEAMNQKAFLLGMKETLIKNPVGYDDDGQVSTAKDLAILAINAMKNPVIKELVSKGYYQVVTSNSRVVDIWSTNLLLGEVDGVVGLKTGFTDNAGECLISYVEHDRNFVVIVLNSEDRFEDSQILIEWVKDFCNK